MKNLIRTIGASCLIGILLFACTEDYFEFDKISTDEWRPELAIPLVNSSLTLEDIVITGDTAGQITPNSDGVLEVVYESSVISTTGQRAYTVPPQLFADTLQTPFPIPSPNPGGSIPFNTSVALDFTDTSGFGIVVDSIILKQGQLAYTIENEYRHKILLEAKFRTFTDENGDTLVINYSIPAATAPTPVQVGSQTVDLTNYQLNMTEDENGNPAENKIPIDLNFIIELDPGQGSDPDEEVRVTGALSNIDFKEFYGYLGNAPLELEKDTFAVELFKNFVTTDFFLSNPVLKVSVFNSFSVPIDFNFLYLDAINPDKNPSVIPFRADDTVGIQPLELPRPANFTTGITTKILNRTNSNIDSVLSFLLQKVAYDSEAQFNPDGVPPPGQQRNFITDTSDIGLDVEFRIPFNGRATNFLLIDTIPFTFDATDIADNGTVRIIADNGFPIEIDLQVGFLDSNNVEFDSLFDNGSMPAIQPSVVNLQTGETISNTREITDVEIDNDKLKRLADGKFAVIRAKLSTNPNVSTPNNGVKFKPEYRLGISIGLRSKIKID